MAIFELCFERTIMLEGGYILHEVPGDRGGMTYAGISRRSWPQWSGWPLVDAGRTIGLELMIQNFYRKNFWAPISGDQIMFQGVAFAIYDFAVNAGVKTSVKIAQKIVGAVADGIVGPKTIAALSGYVRNDETEQLFVAKFGLQRVYRYKDICLADKRRRHDKINSNMKFLCGWINRVQRAVD